MTVPTGSFLTYAAVGIREDLANVIHDISPMDTPFMSNVERVSASAVLHEWQTDALAAASADNAVLEGDDATTNTASPTTRFANNCQISDKVPRVSGTQRAVNTAGRRDEYQYQLMKRGKELKRDIETRLCSQQASVAGSALTPRECAGIGAWLWGNQVKLGDDQTTITVTSGAPDTDPTEATAGTFVEASLKSAVKQCWDDGGNPGVVLLNSFNKQLASGFSGIATLYRDTGNSMKPASILGAADLYISDFGEHQIVASRFTEADAVYVLDLDYWAVAYLRDIETNVLAKTGDSDRAQILAEYTLEAREPNSSAKVYKTTTS